MDVGKEDMINAHTIRHLATLQPSVPAPSKRHLVCAMAERSREGRRRQRISFRLRSTEDSANLGKERREGRRECKRKKKVAMSGGRELEHQLANYCFYTCNSFCACILLNQEQYVIALRTFKTPPLWAEITRPQIRSFNREPVLPLDYLGRHWHHSRDKMDQAFPSVFPYCKRSKTGRWEGLGMRVGFQHTK